MEDQSPRLGYRGRSVVRHRIHASMTTSEHHGFNACLTDYLRVVFCKCPRCANRAVIQAESRYAIPWHPINVRFTCPSCAFHHDWPAPTWESDFANFDPANSREPYFGYTIWAVGQIGGDVLAILNHQHADDLSAFVILENRPRPQNSKWSMVNRLPKWVLLGKNREKVVGLIAQLRALLP